MKFYRICSNDFITFMTGHWEEAWLSFIIQTSTQRYARTEKETYSLLGVNPKYLIS